MRAPATLWLLRAIWISLPFTAGAAVTDALDGRSGAVRAVGFALAWVVWAVVGVASLVTVPVGLTSLRLGAPALGIGAVTVGALGEVTVLGAVGAVSAVLVVVAAFAAGVADHFVNGESYGDERRFALRLPVGFALGAVPVAWLAMTAGLIGGAMLSATEVWPVGVAALVVGAGVAWRAIPAFHRLSRRWLVMVPAGITLVDDLALAEPVLFHKDRIRAVGPATVGTDALDLSGQALGTPLEIRMGEAVEANRRISADEAERCVLSAVLVSPASTAAVLRELERRSGGVFPTIA